MTTGQRCFRKLGAMKENRNTCNALFRGTLMLLLLLLMLTRLNAIVHAQSAGTFTAIGNMTAPRAFHTATLLLNGQVLIAGGDSTAGTTSSAELYDPTTQTFTPTGSMITPRVRHTATLLPDGRVLIVGGNPDSSAPRAELYDPSTGTFTATGNPISWGFLTSMLLQNGKVLNVGAIPELYDPATGTFTPAGAYVTQVNCDFCAPAVGLADGRVLFAQGAPGWAEVYDPITNAWTVTGFPDTSYTGVALLMTGKVLYAGGEDFGRIFRAELYDPDAGTFTPTGNMAIPRVWHTLTLLPNGLVLTAGGEYENCDGHFCYFAGTTASAELYDPSTGTFAPAGTMTTPREIHTATLLNDGSVLITGGLCYENCEGGFLVGFASAELYKFTSGVAINASPTSISPGSLLTATWSGIPSPTPSDWIGLYASGAADTSYLTWLYTTGSANGTLQLSIPENLASGSYELRLFSQNTYTRMAVSNSFTVSLQ